MRVLAALLTAFVIQSLACAQDAAPLPPIQTGEFWYRALDAEGRTEGYMRLVVDRTAGEGIKGSWEMKLAYPGGSYCESRSMEITKELSLIAGSMEVEGGPSGKIRQGEGKLEGSGRKASGAEEKEVVIDGGSHTSAGLTVLFALAMPRAAEAKLMTLEEISLQGVPSIAGWVEVRPGRKVELEREGKTEETWKFEIAREKGPKMQVWVTAEGAIAQIEWGGGSLLVLSSTPTKDLFREIPAAVKDISTSKESLVVQGDFPGFTPQELFDHHTKPELIAKWWAPKAEVGDKVGGAHVLSWPEQKWTLRGEITAWEPGKKFGFTWKWDHEPKEKPALTVTIDFAPLEGGGTRMTITHGPYADTAEAKEERDGHIEGWKFFASKLRALKNR